MSASTAAILIIGNEILSGKTEDSNARYLIGELRELGIELRRIVVVSDSVDEIAEAVKQLSVLFDIVFSSGGVGPTHDDVTIAGIARGFNEPVVRHPELEARIRQYFGEATNESRLRMADVPNGSQLIEAPDLRWPVLCCRNVFVLPGVPELFRMKFAAIRERFRINPFFARAIYTSEDEFELAECLSKIAEAFPSVSIGSYPNFSSEEYRVKLTLESKDENAVKAAFSTLLDRLDGQRIVRFD